MKYVPVHIGTYMRCKRVERVNLSEKVENGENGERGEKCKRVERGEKSERWRRERCDMSSVLNFFNNSVSSCTIFFPCGAKSCHRFFNSLTHHTIYLRHLSRYEREVTMPSSDYQEDKF